MEVLKSLYYDPGSPCAFAGARALYIEAKKYGVTKHQVDEFLEKQDAYTLHRYLRRKFPRNKTVAIGMDSDWQADLADVQRLAKYNDGYKFLLVCVDVLSKYAWVVPVKNKTANEVARGFEQILKQDSRKPWRLYTDKGKEFVGKPFQDMLKQHDIQFLRSESPDVKASIAENFIKSLKIRIWRYFTKKRTNRYVDILPAIVKGLNKRIHCITKRRPIDVNFDNEREVWETLYGRKESNVKFRFSVGDKVRIARKKTAFEQGYLQNFTKEIFTIIKRLERRPPVYELADWGGEPITGVFYESEMVKVHEGDIYEIDKILRHRTRKGINECLVSWKGYPSKFNSWIPMSHIVSK